MRFKKVQSLIIPCLYFFNTFKAILKQIKLVGAVVTLASPLSENFTLTDESFNTITQSTAVSLGPRSLDRKKKLGKEQTNQRSNLATFV